LISAFPEQDSFILRLLPSLSSALQLKHLKAGLHHCQQYKLIEDGETMATSPKSWSARFPVYQIDFAAAASGKRVAATKRRIRWYEEKMIILFSPVVIIRLMDLLFFYYFFQAIRLPKQESFGGR
jgi:hypothetical protein